MRSLATVINDSLIKSRIEDQEVSAIRDLKNPLELRFHKSRQKGTWSYVYYDNGIKRRVRIGYWPLLKTKDAAAMVHIVMQQVKRGITVQTTEFSTIGDLLRWYLFRIEQEALKSQSRRKGVTSAINRHLLPRLDDVDISQVRKVVIDERLILPLQNAQLRPSTIRQYFAILKRVFASAMELGLVTVDPMAGMKFRDHVQRKIEPKASKLLVSDAQRVINTIQEQSSKVRMLLMFMLMFATRIGETRQLKWRYIDFDARQIVIPEKITKTGAVHILPLTEHALSMLLAYRDEHHGEYLFGTKGPMSSSEADMLVREASKRKWSAHDIRKLARSTWATMGIDYWVSERLLNHKQKGLDLVYINADSMDVKRKALERYHAYLFGLYKTGKEQDTQH